MEKSTLVPFLRENLSILFVGLNPVKGSNQNGHYFSVNSAFWNQLFESGLINKQVDKLSADIEIFGKNEKNHNKWEFGITDLITEIAESDSSKIKPTLKNFEFLINQIELYKPKTVVLLHKKVLDSFNKNLFLSKSIQVNEGNVGKLIKGVDTTFFSIAFPHGNTFTSKSKIEKYTELKQFLIQLNNG